jgi:hypothetical protein
MGLSQFGAAPFFSILFIFIQFQHILITIAIELLLYMNP